MTHRRSHVTLAALTVLATLALAAPALAAAPEAPETISPANAITAATAELTGVLNPHSTAKAGWFFAYNQGISCAGGPTTPQEAEVEGEALPEHAEVTGLEPSRQYTFCLVASNEAAETTSGLPEVSFTTAALPPAIDSENATPSAVEATLEAQVNPNNQETTYSFQYATNEALSGATTVAGASAIPAEFGDRTASVSTGAVLTPGTTYFYRVIAENAAHEKTELPVQSFTTLAKPGASTGAAGEETRTSAKLSGTVNPEGAETTFHFAYVEAAGYEPGAPDPYAKGRTTPESGGIGSDYTAHEVGPVAITELKPNVTYHYALVATNSVGTTIGVDSTFTTSPPTPPIAVTGEATGVSAFSATLTGSVDTRELQTMSQFEIGTTPGSGSLTNATAVPGSESGSTVGITLTYSGYLQPGTTYYYRAVATNIDGTGYGAIRSFTTGVIPGLPSVSATAFPDLTSIAPVPGPKATAPPPANPKPLTRAQKLKKALKACNKKPKRQRSACVKAAHKRYGPKAKSRKGH